MSGVSRFVAFLVLSVFSLHKKMGETKTEKPKPKQNPRCAALRCSCWQVDQERAKQQTSRARHTHAHVPVKECCGPRTHC